MIGTGTFVPARREARSSARVYRGGRELALVAALAILPLAFSSPWWGVMLDRDEAAYSVVALGMRHGLVPYRDLFDHKPPLLYVLYVAAFAHGDAIWQPRMLAGISLGATAALLVPLARSLRLPSVAAYAGSALFGLGTANVFLHANANAEALMLPWMTAAFLCAVMAHGQTSWPLAVAAGALAAASVLVKTSAVWPGVVVGVWLLSSPCRARLAPSFAAGAIAALALVCGALVAAGALREAWYANVTYNGLYVGDVALAERITNVWSVNWRVVEGAPAIWAAALAGIIVIGPFRRGDRRAMLLSVWALACWFGVKSTGRDFSHTYVQMLPAAALLAACGVGVLVRWPRGVQLVAAAAFAPLVAWQLALYGHAVSSAEQRRLSHSEDARVRACEEGSLDTAAWLRQHVAVGDTLYNLGRDTELYVYTGTTPGVRYLYDRPFFLDPATADHAARELRARPPRWVVDTEARCGNGQPAPAAVRSLLEERYEHVAIVGIADVYRLR